MQALPVVQAVPLGSGTITHRPVAGLHLSDCWHVAGPGHTTGFDPTQTPFWQVSVCVQALPSLQAVPVSRAQVPFVAAPAATEQAEQTPPLHAMLQQTLSTQKPLAQSVPCAHAVPRAPVPPKSSAVATGVVLLLQPPAASTVPVPSRFAVWK
jgi:hypothetical protein